MGKIFMITVSTVSGPMFFRADSPAAAVEAFCAGLSDPPKYTQHPTFKVEPLTLERLEEVAPEEFMLTGSVDF